MLRVQYILISFLCCMLLAGCGDSAPDGAYSKLVYSIVLPTQRDKLDVWSEESVGDGVLVKADQAIFWVDADNHIFALNQQGVAITDAQSGVTYAPSHLLKQINNALVAAGKHMLNSQGGWHMFKWNNKE
ncbi:hypothetical protein [Halodesulfovibrio aestuarii]|uniref:Uncharacterized protein n=1 Tax=Halodesulfovibrio aestuarii TaxID=126333 RepID=A0A8G2C882_9BACT|nr:hypothetical protein [Halodesulfovibrio aestuarii]SHI77575.1 hypothetical protein SAMN05660830_00947 [Halodesulfovibrio aestuarii]